MVEIRAFDPADLDVLTPAGDASFDGAVDWRTAVRTAAASGPAWTGTAGGRVIGCAGVALLWKGRAAAWCMLDRVVPIRAWIGIHRAVASRLDQMPALGVHRIEAETPLGYLPGVHWLEMLGFEREGLARSYGPNGEDFIRFAKVT